MKKYDKQRRLIKEGSEEQRTGAKHLKKIAAESRRVGDIARNPEKYLDRIDEDFRKKTKLSRTDWGFLFFAIALQCVRQYYITPFATRKGDQEAAKEVKGDKKEHSDRHHRYYHPSLEEITTNPVPFDAIMGSKEKNLGVGGGYKHRAMTLGHDPVLGYVFGTYNIMTSTATLSNFMTYHVKTGTTAAGQKRDAFTENASTMLMFEKGTNRVTKEDKGPLVLATSLCLEHLHLQSDIDSKVSLPVPLISCYSVELSQKLATYGIDAGNLGTVMKQITYASIINAIIAMLHYLCYNQALDHDLKLYEVRTRKILSYSNIIASLSNIIAVAFSAYTGNESALKYLDVGGIIVTIYRIINDYKFKQQIEEEFLEKEFYNLVMGSEYIF